MDKITRVDPKALTMATPKPDQQLDISGVLIPFGLVLCKATLTQMAAGAVLEIRLQDRDTFQDLLMILNRSEDQLLAWEQQDDDYYLWVRKCPG
ncbi:MAG: sulfurtransferase TusA family protein [Syntrophobacterales bacterium]|jgi:TusA-related sulfurtransferase